MLSPIPLTRQAGGHWFEPSTAHHATRGDDNGQYPDSDEYRALFDGHFADYRLRISGLVDNPVELDLPQLRALAHHGQITQHFCIGRLLLPRRRSGQGHLLGRDLLGWLVRTRSGPLRSCSAAREGRRALEAFGQSPQVLDQLGWLV